MHPLFIFIPLSVYQSNSDIYILYNLYFNVFDILVGLNTWNNMDYSRKGCKREKKYSFELPGKGYKMLSLYFLEMKIKFSWLQMQNH